jgi:carbamoylphosphate synthase large subunit
VERFEEVPGLDAVEVVEDVLVVEQRAQERLFRVDVRWQASGLCIRVVRMDRFLRAKVGDGRERVHFAPVC